MDKVWRHADGKGLYGRTLTLKVKYSDFEIITRSRSEPRAIRTREDMQAVALSLLEPVFPVTKGVRLLGVSVSAFGNETVDSSDQQLALEL